ncbi:hypothetical protein LWP59_35725 [Amycolatopsis acidiphila]|uniref:Uncharacterized protein n=1 Tax=Amycolatopsis acidiphila TaxID=715473 RepID=A0A558AJL8_9PSEU|nr:hypothetical protein [Amycolatopsis acidiphila]TVT24453.1 hypothetical protein FNH06_05620 [Amycolatopsis acidiphila]UIJ59339.1 hypothetical protein LWP59_35725 [Amycolatopsis acidiphila]GHG79781.1 hypothetical protein GCM10017788_48330 [Amycolatopsis acidiphila]
MTEQLRHRFPTSALRSRYVTALITACAAGVISGLGSAHFLDSSGLQRAIPALLVAVVVGLAVLAAGAFLVARHADRETVERMAMHLLWVVFALAALPGLVWFALWLSGGSAQSLFGLVAVALGGLPVLAARRKPSALPLTLGLGLLAGVAALLLRQPLFLFLPISAAVTGGWLLVLALLGYARRRCTETVVPSN